MTVIDFTVERQTILLVNGEPLGREKVNIIDGDYQLVLSLNTSVGLGLVRLHDCDVLAVIVDSAFSAPSDDFPHVF